MDEPLNFELFSVRTGNCLKAAKIFTLRELFEKSEYQLSQISNLGRKSLNEINRFIELKKNTNNFPIKNIVSALDLQEYSPKFENEKWVIRKNSDFWLKELSIVNIELSNNAKLLNIYDDIDYQINENKLQICDRRDLAEFRANLLKKHLVLEEVSQICRLVAPWDLIKKISEMSLSVRTSSRLMQMNVYQVFELAEISNTRLTSIPGFGASCLEELKNYLFKLIDDIPAKFEGVNDINSFFDSAVNSIKDNEKLVFTSRIGYYDHYKTLADTAKELGVTRQRIEQIERKISLNIDKIYNIKEFLSKKLDKLLEDRFIPLQISEIKNYDHWFVGLDEKPWLLERFLAFFKISEFSVSNYKNHKIVHRGPKEFIEDSVHELSKWVDKNKATKLTLNKIKDQVNARVKFVAPELFDLVLTEITEKMKFIKIGDDQVMIAIGNSLDTALISIIEQSSVPLNIDEIQRLLNKEQVTSGERYIRAASAKLFLLFGPSLFGIRKHLDFSDSEIITIANSVEQIIHDRNFPRQWHCDRVMEVLDENNFEFFPRLNKYKLSLCLQLSEKFEFLGRLTFTSKSNDKYSKQKRLEFFPMVEFILEQSQIPLHTDHIKALIEKERGLGAYSQITTRGKLISFQEGVWGLIDKHANVSQEDLNIIINELREILLKVKIGITDVEILNYIKKDMFIHKFVSNIYLLFSLAQKSDLFKRDREFLYLLENNSPKRLTKMNAIEESIKKMGQSFKTEDLYRKASELYGSEITYERQYLALMVGKYNYTYDRFNKLYIKNSNAN
jgi:transcriptional regulator with XRE-family HTH domain